MSEGNQDCSHYLRLPYKIVKQCAQKIRAFFRQYWGSGQSVKSIILDNSFAVSVFSFF